MPQKPLALESELVRFRDKLLDSSLRNPLLNYRVSKRKTVELAPASPNDAFQRLVADSTKLRLTPAPSQEPKSPQKTTSPSKTSLSTLSPNTQEPASTHNERLTSPTPAPITKENPNNPLPPLLDNALSTLCSGEKFEALLRGIQRDAKTSIEETGINYLHLAIGFLNWSDSPSSEATTHRAPLILLPIELEQTFSPRGGLDYKIFWNEDEIQSNASLRKKLESDFAIQLPEFDDSTSPSDYFRSVQLAIDSRTNWSVEPSMLLGFFSFHKLSMYVDLDPKLWSQSNALSESSLASQLIAGSDIPSGSGLYAPDYLIDEHPVAQQIELPLDADSSQISALADIASGKSIVIEGPPGTGKSQTIANAICHAMEQGKSILFVAEKLAALEVVHKRLAQAGLADFCLELHGHAASPKKIYDSLSKRLTRNLDDACDSARERSHHASYRSKLFAYLQASSKRVGPYAEPLYDLFWRVVQLRQRQIPLLRELQIDTSIELPEFEEAVQALQAFSHASSQYDLPKQSAWWGFFPKDLTPAESDRIVQRIPSLEQAADSLNKSLSDLSLLFGTSNSLNAEFLSNSTSQNLAPLLTSPVPKPQSGFVPLLDPTTQSRALKLQQLVDDFTQATNTLSQHLETNHSATPQTLSQLANRSEQHWQVFPRDTEIWKLAEFQSWVNQLEILVGKLFETTNRLKTFGFPEPLHLDDLERTLSAVHLSQHSAVQGTQSLASEWFSDATRKLLAEAKSKSEELIKRRETIRECFHLPSAPDPERLLFLIKQFRTHGSSWFRWFSGDYRSVMKELRQFATFPKGMSQATILSTLESFYSFEKDRSTFENNPALKKLLDTSFQGLETDWTSITTLSDWVATAKKMGIDHRRANELLATRDELVQAFSIRDLKQTIQALDTESVGPCAKQIAIGANGEKWHRSIRLMELANQVARWKNSLREIEQSSVVLKQGNCAKLGDLLACVTAAKKLEQANTEIQRTEQLGDPADLSLLREAQTGKTDYRKLFEWMKSLQKARLPEHLFAAMDHSSSEAVCASVLKTVKDFEQAEQDWQSARKQITGTAEVDATWMCFRDSNGTAKIALAEEVKQLKKESARLPAWLAFCRTMERCNRAGVSDFAMAAATDQIDESQLSDAYQLAIFHRLAELELQSNEIGFHFTTTEMNDIRSNFQRLDRMRIESKQLEIAKRVSQRQAPEGNSKGRVGEYTEMGLIRHEIGKKSRHCKTRDLMTRAGRAVQALKPCFLMSPLSLARFLPASTIEFDMVIMDEASQIKPEDAIGAILRAKQLVVVGDPKQLPPTSFFDQADDEIDEEDATQLDNAESVLEVAQRSFQPYRRLRWHYRSQHENLIQFSNVKFYDEDLVVFPSPSDTLGGLGIVYHHVQDANCVKGENLREAERIVERIIEHAKQRTGESLGVAAFNQKQSELIDTLVNKACGADPEFATLYAQMREGENGFFVKNLENIQGDERDVIFISYTYGRDPTSGKVFQRFGPINSQMGWRRLNVMVTRARKRMEVFSSLLPSDIHGGPDKSRGVNAYRDFLEYASVGKMRETGSESGREPGSPFEEAVAKVVESAGLEAVFQVGVAGYFIDIGVRRREGDRSFLLGIECDGATYHSSKSARDRDRLREEIIKGRGWNLYRIWSTDWFLNQAAEEERLLRRLRECVQ